MARVLESVSNATWRSCIGIFYCSLCAVTMRSASVLALCLVATTLAASEKKEDPTDCEGASPPAFSAPAATCRGTYVL